jgi:hypothetical protein
MVSLAAKWGDTRAQIKLGERMTMEWGRLRPKRDRQMVSLATERASLELNLVFGL